MKRKKKAEKFGIVRGEVKLIDPSKENLRMGEHLEKLFRQCAELKKQSAELRKQI